MKKRTMYIKKIKDLNVASAMKASKLFRLDRTEWEGGIAYWNFEDQHNQSEVFINKYINGELIGNIKDFVEAQKTLKNLIFNRNE